MSCPLYKDEILESIRNQKVLPENIRKHIGECEACNEYHHAQQNLTNSLRELKEKDQALTALAPPHELLNALKQEDKPVFQNAFWMKAAAVFMVSLLCGAYWIYRTEYPQDSGDQKITANAANHSDDYVPLTYGMAQDEPLQKIRVKLPRSALDDFGITLNQARSDEVTADLIVGESGIPYAIRVVQK